MAHHPSRRGRSGDIHFPSARASLPLLPSDQCPRNNPGAVGLITRTRRARGLVARSRAAAIKTIRRCEEESQRWLFWRQTWRITSRRAIAVSAKSCGASLRISDKVVFQIPGNRFEESARRTVIHAQFEPCRKFHVLLNTTSRVVERFCNKRGRAEQRMKEGKQALKMTSGSRATAFARTNCGRR